MRRRPAPRPVALGLAAAMLAGGCVRSADGPDTGDASEALTTTRPGAGDGNLRVTPSPAWTSEGGNRVTVGLGAMDRATPIDVTLPGRPVRVLPVRSGWETDDGGPIPGDAPVTDLQRPEPRWFVELESGEVVVVDAANDVVADVVAWPEATTDSFDDPLPDGRPVQAGPFEVALVGPTDRYPHGALGDRIEAAGVQVLGVPGLDRVRFGPDPPTVIEGLSALVGDATGDGRPEILVTHSNAEVGAWLALWSPTGELVAQSDPIGTGNRWRNQLAIAPVGPDGEIEVVDVRTPHIGGTVQYHRVVGDRLEIVARQPGFTSHRFASPNLDEGVVVDADGDGTLDVVVPTDDRTAMGILTRTSAGAGDPDAGDAGGVTVVAEIDLPGRLSTNVAARPVVEDQTGAEQTDPTQRPVDLAVGTDEGILRIWPASSP